MKFAVKLVIFCLVNNVLCGPTVNNSLQHVLDDGEKRYYLSRFQTTFFSAYIYCRAQGMQLLTVSSAAEESAIEEFLITKVEIPVWTSGIRLRGESSFMWMSTGRFVTYTKWANDQPALEDDADACIQIWPQEREWHDQGCNMGHYFVCESVSDESS